MIQSTNVTDYKNTNNDLTTQHTDYKNIYMKMHQTHSGRVAPTWFMILVQLNLDQELNRVHAELCCTKLNLDQLERPWLYRGRLRLVKPCSARRPTTVTSHALMLMLTKQSSTD